MGLLPNARPLLYTVLPTQSPSLDEEMSLPGMGAELKLSEKRHAKGSARLATHHNCLWEPGMLRVQSQVSSGQSSLSLGLVFYPNQWGKPLKVLI